MRSFGLKPAVGIMSVQFGKWNFDGKPVDPKELDEIRPVLAPYGPDGEGSICKNNLAILYRAFHTTRESYREHQPYVLPSGSILTWDGRLDNRDELIERLGGELNMEATDLEIVGAAYERWNTDGFPALNGDWALSIWDPRQHSIILAKDFVGTRHLYYSIENDRVKWSTILDPLVLFAGHSFRLEEEYIAGWLGFFPATHLTPYAGIHSVPPACFVRLRQGGERTSKYWDFDPGKKIRYPTDAEYEEHFRQTFRESVRRRLRSDCPILAELSGGMDSSSMVCMADSIAGPSAAIPRVDTLSYYDDSEPNWNERPYLSTILEKRGRPACCVDLGKTRPRLFPDDGNRAAILPSGNGLPAEITDQICRWIAEHGNRVVLSGLGGDELLGGVPTPLPEIADLLASWNLRELVLKLQTWALAQRQPLLHLLLDAARTFLPSCSAMTSIPHQIGLRSQWIRRHRSALTGYERRLTIWGALPSFQDNLKSLETLRRQFSTIQLSTPLSEKRYPYLDRDLVEFLLAIPREQVVRPHQRRSLMRRALISIVPSDVLNRKRKAFITRRNFEVIREGWQDIEDLLWDLQLEKLGAVDARRFREMLEQAKRGDAVPLLPLIRMLALESWLRQAGRTRRIRGAPLLSTALSRSDSQTSRPRKTTVVGGQDNEVPET